MIPVHRVGDLNTGHPAFPPVALSENGSTVKVNNQGIGRETDPYPPHCSNATCHPGNVEKGSGKTYAENLPIARQGDSVTCSGLCFCDKASPDVFDGG